MKPQPGAQNRSCVRITRPHNKLEGRFNFVPCAENTGSESLASRLVRGWELRSALGTVCPLPTALPIFLPSSSYCMTCFLTFLELMCPKCGPQTVDEWTDGWMGRDGGGKDSKSIFSFPSRCPWRTLCCPARDPVNFS